ncbi:MAG: hypothetical protein ACOCRX_00900 [Candidatus Woesearchaeota archaeon]
MKSIRTTVDTLDNYDLFLNNKLELVLKKGGTQFTYPVVLDSKMNVIIPNKYVNLHKFLQQELNRLGKKDTLLMLSLFKLDLRSFLITFCINNEIDIFINKNEYYVQYNNAFYYLNTKNMDENIIKEIMKNDNWDNEEYAKDIKNDLFAFVRGKIIHSLGSNEFINKEIKNFKETQLQLEREFSKPEFNIPRILAFYEQLIRLREEYLHENHDLLPKKTVREISTTMKKIRSILKKANSTVTVKEEEKRNAKKNVSSKK